MFMKERRERPKFTVGDKVIFLLKPEIQFEVIERKEIHVGIFMYHIIAPKNKSHEHWVIEFELMTWVPPLPKRKFKKGDLVTVKGYENKIYEVTEYLDAGLYEVVNIKEGYEMLAATEDMVKIDDTELDKHIHINQEKRTLQKLEENKKKIAKLKGWNNSYFELYLFTKDEKYLRRIKKINKLIEKIPTRAFQI